MKIPVAVLHTLFACLVVHVMPAHADLLDAINEIRAQGCGDQGGGQPALRRDSALDRVAEALATGKDLRDAMAQADYRALQSATFQGTGTPAAIGLALAQRGCMDVIDPAYREVGIAMRPNEAWVVLAQPLIPPAASEAGSISQRVLVLVNAARAQSRRCGWKRYPAAPPVALSEILQRAALAHARDMAERGILSHTGRDGSAPAERATRAGYRWRFVGENIAAGQPTPEAVVAEWTSSPNHCANLMDTDYTEMGIAFATGAGKAGIYWAQVFGAPSS